VLTLYVPVTIVTGFLGSGKTTLVSEWLNHPEYANSAVIVNEAGQLGIDDVTLSDATDVVELVNGCFCCVARNSIGVAFRNVLLRKGPKTNRTLSHVFVETSGLASPSAILVEMARDGLIANRFGPSAVIAVVDAVNGLKTLLQHEEARRQVRLADQIVITKLDVASSDKRELERELAKLNTHATLEEGRFPPTIDALSRTLTGVAKGKFIPTAAAVAAHSSARSYLIDGPLQGDVVTAFFQHLANEFGNKILRLKGLVAVKGEDTKIALIQGVQGIYYPVQWVRRSSVSSAGFPLVIICQELQPEALDAAVFRFAGASTTLVSMQ
jgi:G3E family GTPase